MKLRYLLFALLVLLVALPVGGYIYLTTLDFETLKVRLAREVEAATGRQLKIGGPIDLAIGLQPSVTVEDATLSNAEWGSRPEMVALERLELELELMPLFGGEVQVNRLVLVGPDILLETAADGQPNWALSGDAGEPAGAGQSEAGAQTGEEPLIPQIEAVEIRDGELLYRDGATGETTSLSLESLTLRRETDRLALDLAALFQGAEIELSGTIGELRAVIADTPFPLDLAGTLAGNELSVSGVIEQPQTAPKPDLEIALSGDDLASFAPLAGGAAIPALGPYSLQGRTVVDGQTYGLDGLKLTLGDSDLSGVLSADLSGARPKVVADLTAAVLHLKDFQPAESESAAGTDAGDAAGGSADGDQGAGSDSPYVIPDTPLPLDALTAADATVQLKAGVLRVDPELEFRDLSLGVDLANGNLQVAPLRAAYQQSRLDGQLGLDASAAQPQLRTQIVVDEFDFGRLLNAQGLTDEVEGTMDIRLDLTGSGASPRAIAGTLAGTTEVVNEGGTISNKLLAIIGADVDQILGPLLGESDTTALNCIVSRFDIAEGVATSRALVLDTATFSLAGTGTVDLGSEALDLTFDTASRVPALVSLAIPFRVQGTLKEPQVFPDPAGALKGIAGAAASVSNPLAVLGGLAAGAVVDEASDGTAPREAGNPCLTALDPEAQKAAGADPAASQPAVPRSVEDVGQAVEDLVPESAGEDAGEAVQKGVDQLRGLFGD